MIIANVLSGYRESLLPGSSIGIFTPRFGLGALNNPKSVGKGEGDIGFTTPSINGKFAFEGKGPYDQSVPNLRGIAALPHDDYVIWAVSKESGIKSFEDIKMRKYPLRLVTGRKGSWGTDPLTFTVELVLKQYGMTFEDIERWGGSVNFAGWTGQCVSKVKSGEYEAIFQEAQQSIHWNELADTRQMNFLAVDQAVVGSLAKNYGFSSRIMPKERYKGVHDDTLTVDFSGWLVFCNADLPNELAYTVTKAFVEQRAKLELLYQNIPAEHRDMQIPLDPGNMSKTMIPLHQGAKAYYSERGYLE
jgi:hypothetical protein